MFERMIRSMKMCSKKAIGGARLSCDELLTVITQVEATLDSLILTGLVLDVRLQRPPLSLVNLITFAITGSRDDSFMSTSGSVGFNCEPMVLM